MMFTSHLKSLDYSNQEILDVNVGVPPPHITFLVMEVIPFENTCTFILSTPVIPK